MNLICTDTTFCSHSSMFASVLFLRLLFLLRHCAPIDVRNVRFLTHVDTALVSSNRPFARVDFAPRQASNHRIEMEFVLFLDHPLYPHRIRLSFISFVSRKN